MAEAAAAPTGSLLGLLLRVKVRSLWNRIRQAADEAPLRLFVTVSLVAVIWYGLYWLFDKVFLQLSRTPLEATVAIPLVFNVFFAAMLVLLAFSNAIISYGALFGKDESAYLLSSPLTPLDVVTLKYLESLVMASWSLILLGVPLMLAMARLTDDSFFYVLFLAFFLAFLPIPAAAGMMIAWAAARWFPRTALRGIVLGTAALLALTIVYGIKSFQSSDPSTTEFLRSFYSSMSFVELAFLPNQWVAAGISHAQQNRFAESGLYLGVTFANALFFSWLAVTIVAGCLSRALDHATAGRSGGRRIASAPTGGISGLVFFYLPTALRLIAAKDLRTFLRDPLQWSQLAILFSLLALYLANMPTLKVQLGSMGWSTIIPFLNLAAISFLMATFTCRFVFPLVSLEGRKLWLVGVLPIPRGGVLYAKFAFAMTVTLGVALSSMALAIVILDLSAVWAVIHLAVTVAVCIGLCGFAVGIGARLPMFEELNAARIANGFGGTTNLLASVGLVALVLAGVGVATWRTRYSPESLPDLLSAWLCFTAIVVSISAGLLALKAGAKAFNRVEV